MPAWTSAVRGSSRPGRRQHLSSCPVFACKEMCPVPCLAPRSAHFYCYCFCLKWADFHVSGTAPYSFLLPSPTPFQHGLREPNWNCLLGIRPHVGIWAFTSLALPLFPSVVFGHLTECECGSQSSSSREGKEREWTWNLIILLLNKDSTRFTKGDVCI